MRTKLVVDMKDQRPVWAMPDWAVEEIRGALPGEWIVHVVQAPADGSGDGRGGASSQAVEAVAHASVYLGFGIPPELLRAGRELRWVHSGTAGVGSSLTPEMKAWDGIFTNSAGIHGPPIGETVVAMILHFARGLDFAVQAQARGEWRKEPFQGEGSPVREVAGSTVGIVGFGGVGREVARRLAALGARILGLKRRESDAARDPETGAELVWGPGGLARLQAESDYLVISAPETDRTRNLVDAGFLSGMRRGAVLVNVSRGKLVDQEALARVLQEGGLRGAGLDVFRKEPLPSDSALWRLPNVLLTPHVSAVTRGYWRREVDLVKENIRRFLEGTELLNVVDREAGY